MLLVLAVLAVPFTQQGTDTTFAVRGATRLELSSADGGITVQTWSRSAIRVEAAHNEDSRIEVDQAGRTVSLRARARYGPAEVNWKLTVPADMAL
jgi:hypothetical protein